MALTTPSRKAETSSLVPEPAGRWAVRGQGISKMYRLYARPSDRLKQLLLGGRRTYGRELWALRDIRLDVLQGESVGIIGRNGSGKSTLLQIVAGVLRPTMGELEVVGRVGALLELGASFTPELSGRQNVYISAAALGLDRRQIDLRFEEIAAFAEIGEFIEYPVKLYSTGMFVRLAFAIQAVLRPELLIIDEALSVGDYPFQRRCVRYLERYVESGGTLILTSHDIGLVQRLCSRALVLHEGRIVVDDEPSIAAHQYVTRFSQMPMRAIGQAHSLPPLPVEPAESGLSIELFMRAALTRPEKSGFLSREVEILGVRVENAAGGPSISFNPGDVMRVRTLFVAHTEKPYVSNGLLIHDVSGALVWGGGTVNQGKVLEIAVGKRYISTIEVTLNLGPGRYDLTVGLSTPHVENNARTGEFHDRFVNVATLEISDFDLSNDEPVPFWGLASLPYRVPPVLEVDA